MARRTIKKDQVIVKIGGYDYMVTSVSAATKIAQGFKGAVRVDKIYSDPSNEDVDYIIEEEKHRSFHEITIVLNQRVASRKNLLGLPSPEDE